MIEEKGVRVINIGIRSYHNGMGRGGKFTLHQLERR
jgi:hypothetical protein